MTNLEYIKSQLTDVDMADLLSAAGNGNLRWRAMSAFWNWAEKFGDHCGNVVSEKGNPSIWAYELWHYPDGHTERRGHPFCVSIQTWLGHQYCKEDWE